MAEKSFRLEIISPDRIFYTNDVTMVEYNTVDGEVGVYAEHIPMTQIIAPGRLTITEENGQKTAALLSGFVEITPEKVTILAEAVEWPQNIDVARPGEPASGHSRFWNKKRMSGRPHWRRQPSRELWCGWTLWK